MVAEAGGSVGRYSEINYLEQVFVQMEQSRHTSMGTPLPDYVHYRPGLCPQVEAAAPQLIMFGVMPWNDDEALLRNCEVLRKVMEKRAG
jgi:hypothetical protein